MKRDLENIVVDIKNSKGPQLLLLFGDDLQVQGACKTLLDNLVPESQRGLNLEQLRRSIGAVGPDRSLIEYAALFSREKGGLG